MKEQNKQRYTDITIDLDCYFKYRLTDDKKADDSAKKEYINIIIARLSRKNIVQEATPIRTEQVLEDTNLDTKDQSKLPSSTSSQPIPPLSSESVSGSPVRLSALPINAESVRPPNDKNPLLANQEIQHKTNLWKQFLPYLNRPIMHAIGTTVLTACSLTYIGNTAFIVWSIAGLVGLGIFSLEKAHKWREGYMQSTYHHYQIQDEGELKKTLKNNLNAKLALKDGVESGNWLNYGKSYLNLHNWTNFKDFGAGLQSVYSYDRFFQQKVRNLTI